MLAEGVWEEDDNTPIVMIGNRLEVKSGRTPFRIEFEEAVKNAEKQIQNDGLSVRLIQRINDEQIDLQQIKQEQKILNKLIRLGIVTVFLDNTIVLSPIGKQVLNNLQKSAGQLQ